MSNLAPNYRLHRLADLPPDLRLAADELGPGESRSGLVCPVCSGGRSGETSFNLSRREGFITLTCWRAGCGYRARIPLGGPYKWSPPKFAARPYTRPLVPLPEPVLELLAERYWLDEELLDHYGVQYAPEEEYLSVYLPVYGPTAGPRGGIIRRLEPGVQPKTLTYKCTDEPWMAWMCGSPRRPPRYTMVVVVEDMFSALRCADQGYAAVALLGTSLSQERVEEIARVQARLRLDRVLLALDADAFGVAIRYCLKYGDRLRGAKAVLLGKDLKDVSPGELVGRLEAAAGNVPQAGVPIV